MFIKLLDRTWYYPVMLVRDGMNVWNVASKKKPHNPEAAVWRLKRMTWNSSRGHIIRKDPHINKLDLEKQIFQWYTYSHTHTHAVACCCRIITIIILLDSIRNIILRTGSSLSPSKPVSSHTLFSWQDLSFLALEPKQISVDFGWQCWLVCVAYRSVYVVSSALWVY